MVGVFYSRFEQEEPDTAKENMGELIRLYPNGDISPHIHQVFGLEDYTQALQSLTTREVVGKVIVEMERGNK